jgi:hypothetical protein
MNIKSRWPAGENKDQSPFACSLLQQSELLSIRPAQWEPADCLISFGRSHGHPYPLFLPHPPSLRNIYTDFQIFGIGYLKDLVFWKDLRCLIGLAWGRQDGEGCITHQCANQMCPMTIRLAPWDAFLHSVGLLLVPCTQSRVSAREVLLTRKFIVRLAVRIWWIPPQDVIYQNSSSISDSQGFVFFLFLSDQDCCS